MTLSLLIHLLQVLNFELEEAYLPLSNYMDYLYLFAF